MSVSGTLPPSCCKLPPIEAEYTPKGTYKEIHGLKTYVSGDENAKSAVLMVYDVFGLSPQIIQGADLLASQGHAVYMPDFLKGDYVKAEWFSGSEDGNKKRTEWFSKFPGAAATQAEPVGKFIAELKSKHSKLGGVGYCWGWKVLVLTQNADKLDALAGCHPSFIAADDVDKISAPTALLPSQGEDMKIIKEIYEGLEKKNPGKVFYKQFDQMPHGWMAARGDVKGGEGLKGFQEGYETLAGFFKQYLA